MILSVINLQRGIRATVVAHEFLRRSRRGDSCTLEAGSPLPVLRAILPVSVVVSSSFSFFRSRRSTADRTRETCRKDATETRIVDLRVCSNLT